MIAARVAPPSSRPSIPGRDVPAHRDRGRRRGLRRVRASSSNGGGSGEGASSATSADEARASASAAELKAELLGALGKGGDGATRMARVGDRSRLEALVVALEDVNPNPRPFERPDLLLNEWQLITTFKPGTADVTFTDPESWRKYIFESGPSPVQSLVVGNTSVDNVFQVLEDPRESPGNGAKWQNIVEFGPPGTSLVIEAVMEGVRDDDSFFYRFSGGYFQIDGALGGPDGMRLPYPVPFDLLEAARPVGKGVQTFHGVPKEHFVRRGNDARVQARPGPFVCER